MKFSVGIADPPWKFGDPLAMQGRRRGAASRYATLSTRELIDMGHLVRSVTAPDSIFAMWTPAALLADGFRVLDAWGYTQKGVYVWVKQTRDRRGLAFGMGRQFRGACELALIGTRGRPRPVSMSERNVALAPATTHSVKPYCLHEALERMYPDADRVELFATRVRPGWVCVGNECPDTLGRDARDVLRDISCA